MFIDVKSHEFEMTDAIKSYAEEKLALLEKYDDQIVEIRCELKKESNKHQHGDVFACSGHLFIPGKDFFVEKTEEDLYKAIDKVKDHLQDMLVEYKEKQREG